MSWIAKIGSAFLILIGSITGIFTTPASQSPQVGSVPSQAIAKTAPAGSHSTNASTKSPSSVASPTVPAPPQTAASATTTQTWQPGTQWVNISGPNGSTIKTAITWPAGQGPFPVIILLHGSDGFRQTYVAVAQQMAVQGFVTVAPCWFTGFHAPMSDFSDYIDCPNGPSFSGANLTAVKVLDVVIAYTQNLPGVKPNRIGLIGSSRGSTLALLAASTENDVEAVVSVSAIYETMQAPPGFAWVKDTYPSDWAATLAAPVLVLYGTGDAIVSPQQPKDYIAKLSSLGKPFDSYSYDGAPHTILYTAPYSSDVQARAISFFQKYLGK